MDKQELIASLAKRGFSPKILEAFEKVKREDFVLQNMKSLAYADIALPIGFNQTISQPYTIAVMLSLLKLKQGQDVLEVGSGSGYVLALMSEIVGEAGKVFGVELVQKIADKSRNILKHYSDIELFNRDGRIGLPEKAPFDRILISAACMEIPEALTEQLKEGGILVAPIGELDQAISQFKKEDSSLNMLKEIPGFVFVRFV